MGLVRNKMEEVKLIPNVEFIESLASDQHKYVQDDGMVEIVYEQKTRERKKNINSNLHVINVILVLFGIMSIVFIMYEGYYLSEHLHRDNISGPILGFIISLYSVTSGSAYFAVKTSVVRNLKSRIIFCSINIFFGLIMCVSMSSLGVINKWHVANISGSLLGLLLFALGVIPIIMDRC